MHSEHSLGWIEICYLMGIGIAVEVEVVDWDAVVLLG